ncbi:signal recognition particle-docking protein FtsY [Bifidobacterium pseudolongum]|jgi:fused signal recognition particle receptor|uniref:Signal recognition particle receptor FtsY n=1 Tax=Bifidobacterium pseudolongum subsp. globosum TaxID=1690 RepID=A0A4Q5AH43_9BIFI|nr:signal recognition particle-docking protein FtsY [Bifidobacterium pseudolongum]RYQ02273.1 signal recognition particle-docking protein FtsY [Bifidobacterium pseudolongum subsp. globosum]RYQ06460.1 signal recognition particle-docking protein FtsY [Bifidobacterium pseudolongum subsp. globosum]RYQ13255.1 signal recognition particle-docking protein FtsY [Bifidobacterium pseudolongum subsp. globosum]RYQ27196.1 signal recognition particle-docking protein FtsY [Bifidobacterium pseudolongum subsp. gl
MDTNMVYGIIAVVVIAVLLIVGGIWMDRSRKKNIQQSQEAAKAKADERLAAERAAQKPTVPEPAEAKQSPAEQTPDALAPPAEAPVEEVETVEETGVVEEPMPPVEKPEGKKGRLQRLRERLSKSGNPFGKALFNILAKDHLSETDWEDVEDTLLLADVGAEASEQLVEQLRTDARVTGETDPTQLREALRGELLALVGTDVDRSLEAEKPGAKKPSVIIMVGVNGTGKTTTAGKLARLFVSEDKTVMLGAADTFRAAAADQLETWGAKVDVPVVRSDKEGADPASVAFEAAAKAKDDDVDVLIIDTAGRLQNKANLMDELGKIRRVTEKNLPVDEVLLVLDATTGQNGMAQAKVFAEAIGITGVVLTKLDGSAKGGIVISVQKELGVPVKLVGVGEGPDDLAPFDPESFVDGILG